MTVIYVCLALVFLNILTIGIFSILRHFDKQKIQKLNIENKEMHKKNLQSEVSRMSLIRQNDEKNKIIKKMEDKIRIINKKTLEESINEL